MTNLTGKTLVERLRAAANDGELSSDTFEQAADRIEALEERLEINHAYQVIDGKMTRVAADMSDHDGISCRDETIKLQRDMANRLARRIEALEAALREAQGHLKLDTTGSPLKGWVDALKTINHALEQVDD